MRDGKSILRFDHRAPMELACVGIEAVGFFKQAGALHDLDDPHHAVGRDSVAGEVDDFVLGHPFAFEIGGEDVVVDFVHGLGVGTDRPGFEDLRHEALGLKEPTHGGVEDGLGEEELVAGIDRGDHRQLKKMRQSSGVIMGEFWMVWHRGLVELAPVVDGGAVVFGGHERTTKRINKPEIVNHIRAKTPSALGKEIIGDDPFVGEDHKDAGGEALVPCVFGHELD